MKSHATQTLVNMEQLVPKMEVAIHVNVLEGTPADTVMKVTNYFVYNILFVYN